MSKIIKCLVSDPVPRVMTVLKCDQFGDGTTTQKHMG